MCKLMFYVTWPDGEHAEVVGAHVVGYYPCQDILAGPFLDEGTAFFARDIFNDLFFGKKKSFEEAFAAASTTPDDLHAAAGHWCNSVAWAAGKSAEGSIFPDDYEPTVTEQELLF